MSSGKVTVRGAIEKGIEKNEETLSTGLRNGDRFGRREK